MPPSSKSRWLPHERVLAGLICAVTLFFIPGAGSPFVLPKVFILIVGSLVLTAFSLNSRSKLHARRLKNVNCALGLLWLGFLWASLRCYSLYSALLGEYNRANALGTYTALILIFFAISRLFFIEGINRILNPVIAVALLISAYGYIQLFGLDPIEWAVTSSSYISFLGNSNFVSAYLGISGVAAFLQVLLHKSKSREQLIYLLITIFLVFSIIESGSQQGLFAFAGGVVIISLVIAFQKQKQVFYVGLAFSVMGGVSTVFGLLGKGPLSAILRQGTLAYRGDYMWAGWQMAVHNPLTGIGLDRYGDYFRAYRSPEQVRRLGPELISNDAHSIPLQMAASGGLVLFIIYTLFISFISYVGLRNVVRTKEQTQLVNAGLLGCWAAYVVQAGVSIENPSVALIGWIFAGAILAIYVTAKDDENTKQKIQKLVVAKVLTAVSIVTAFAIGISGIYVVSTDLQISNALNYTLANQDTQSINLHVQKIENVIKSNTNIPELLMKVSQKYLSYGVIDGGKFYIEKSLELNPRYYPALNAQAVVAESEKNFNSASLLRKRNLKFDPYNLENYLALVRISLAQSDRNQASVYLENMKKLSELSPFTLQAQELLGTSS